MKGVAGRAAARWGRDRRYWRLRRLASQLRLRIVGQVFRARYAARDTATNAGALRTLLRLAVLPLLAVAGVIVILAATDPDARKLAADLGLGRLQAGAYEVLLESVIAATGVFLALYFAIVSSIAAATYAEVPNDIRTLLVRDRYGNVYVYLVSLTMALAVALLAIDAINATQYSAGVVLIAAMSVLSIFAFIQLGRRAFHLTDPTLLVPSITRDFVSWQQRATRGGWRWDQPEFQERYRVEARRCVTTLAGVLTLTRTQSHLRSTSGRQLARRIVALVAGYLRTRRRIPTDSRWFDRRLQHPSWYLTDSVQLQMASATSSTLQPKEVPDHHWVEKALLTPIVDAIASGDLEDTYVALDTLRPLGNVFGYTWNVREGISWNQRILVAIGPLLDVPPPDSDSDVAKLMVGVADQLGSFIMEVELGLHRALTHTEIGILVSSLEAADWSSFDAPYDFHLPDVVLQRLESLGSGVRFESESEVPRDVRTPGWYVRQVALNSMEWAIHSQITAITGALSRWYGSVSDRLTTSGQLEATGAFHARGLEAAWKLEAHTQSWEALVAGIGDAPAGIDLNRPEWDWDSIHESPRKLKRELVQRLAKSIPELSVRSPSKEMPDYLGQAVHRTGEACFEALMADDDELFVSVFPTYFLGIFVIFDRLREEVADWLPEVATSWMTEPIADAMTLSGHALILGELHNDGRAWNACQEVWIRYLSGEDGLKRLEGIAAMGRFQRTQFAISPRSVLRTGWLQALERVLSELPRERGTNAFDAGEVIHASPLIRRLVPRDDGFTGLSLVDPSDVFVARFLAHRPGADAFDFGLKEWIANELGDDESAEDGG